MFPTHEIEAAGRLIAQALDRLRRKLLTLVFGPEEDISYVSTTGADPLHTHHENLWAALDPSIRERAVTILREKISVVQRHEIASAIEEDPDRWWAPHHFFWGMGIRNLLRNGGIYDAELPTGNWDDYYIAAVEQTVNGIAGGVH